MRITPLDILTVLALCVVSFIFGTSIAADTYNDRLTSALDRETKHRKQIDGLLEDLALCSKTLDRGTYLLNKNTKKIQEHMKDFHPETK